MFDRSITFLSTHKRTLKLFTDHLFFSSLRGRTTAKAHPKVAFHNLFIIKIKFSITILRNARKFKEFSYFNILF